MQENFLIYVLIIGILVLLPRKTGKNKQFLFLLRAFIPTWRFFEDIGDQPLLEARIQNQNGETTQWETVIPKGNLKPNHFFWNPENNKLIAYQTTLTHLIFDLNELLENQNIETFSSFLVVKNITRENLLITLAKGFEENGYANKFQFKISLKSDFSSKKSKLDLLISPWYKFEDL